VNTNWDLLLQQIDVSIANRGYLLALCGLCTHFDLMSQEWYLNLHWIPDTGRVFPKSPEEMEVLLLDWDKFRRSNNAKIYKTGLMEFKLPQVPNLIVSDKDANILYQLRNSLLHSFSLKKYIVEDVKNTKHNLLTFSIQDIYEEVNHPIGEGISETRYKIHPDGLLLYDRMAQLCFIDKWLVQADGNKKYPNWIELIELFEEI
jgi:hypothetical protein